MDRRHIISGIFWLIISIFVCLNSTKLGIGNFSTPGPGFLFFWSSLLLGLLSVILIIKNIFMRKEAKLLINLWKGLRWEKVFLTIIAILIYSLILTELGFLFATFFLMIFLFSLGRLRYWMTIMGALITVMVSYIIFHFLLQIQFPRGILGW